MRDTLFKIALQPLMPNDTRSVEYVSAFVLVLASFTGVLAEYFHTHQIPTSDLWNFALACAGLIHVGALVVDRLHMFRAIACYIAAPFWVWIGVHEYTTSNPLNAMVLFTVGISIFYAAGLHFLVATRRWK